MANGVADGRERSVRHARNGGNGSGRLGHRLRERESAATVKGGGTMAGTVSATTAPGFGTVRATPARSTKLISAVTAPNIGCGSGFR